PGQTTIRSIEDKVAKSASELPMTDSPVSQSALSDGYCGIVWFRNDLRVEDNPAWDEATRTHDQVVALYVLDPAIADRTGPLRRRRHLMELRALDETLREHGGRLHIVRGSPLEVVPELVDELQATGVYVNASPSALSRSRDAQLVDLLPESTRLSSHWGNLVQPPGGVTTAAGNVPRVFTSFWKRWRAAPPPEWAAAKPDATLVTAKVLDLGAGDSPRFVDPSEIDDCGDADGWTGVAGSDRAVEEISSPDRYLGTDGAHARLAEFIEHGLGDYAEQRDAPYLDGSSDLSVPLHFGTIAAVRVMAAAEAHGGGAEAFIRQLAWRDWYAHLLWENPALPRHAMRPEFELINWRNDRDEIDAWKQGLTGYPIVDAGMRQLASTGRMHNRVRMVTASFLVKDLLVDWKIGERYFRRTLLDGDVAQNAGNWQWVAGTGPDAAPYFRIFNPVRQGEVHDPDGEYVRRWLPELSGLPTRYIHAPWRAPEDVLQRAGVSLGRNYPTPIVDHSEARAATLAAYKLASNK
ncbi:MAG TPA: deoxyribodipyrimidine photo-lyase, partial [Microthrixaceae bacterium]|nr:deoxyribodipyrimidine photo-lyase [Microthrixaceae bacterium]